MGAEQRGPGQVVVLFGTTGNRMTSIDTTDKPFRIEKRQVYESYKAVKANPGAAGVDTDGLLFLSPERSIPRLCRILFC